MKKRIDVFEKAKTAKRESKFIEFKDRFDVDSAHQWCETIKDIAAMANSGGGIIIFGVKNNGGPSGFDIISVLNLDPAVMTDKIATYTGEQFSDFEIRGIDRNGNRAAALLIKGVSIPVIFTRPGTYDSGGGRQKTAFAKGTVYFRHGAKSEPGIPNDIRRAVEREIERVRKSWLGNIRKIAQAPVGSCVQVQPPAVRVSNELNATPIKAVDSPNAPAYRIEGPDATYSHREKEVVQCVNERLAGERTINRYDIRCVRSIYKINKSKPGFYYKSRFASPQYSEAFVNWLVDKYKEDPYFFYKVRNKYRESQ